MRLRKLVFLFAAVAAFSAICRADSFSFTGNFTRDDNVQFFNFTILDNTTVTLKTLSNSGGVNFAGETIAPLGFDPVLELFAVNVVGVPSGLLRGVADDGGDCASTDPFCSDALLTMIDLLPGDYTLALTQFDNCILADCVDDPHGVHHLSEGFLRAGQGNFTGGPFIGIGFASQPQLDSHWAVDIVGADVAQEVTPVTPVPEPTTLALFGSGVVAMAGFARRKLKS